MAKPLALFIIQGCLSKAEHWVLGMKGNKIVGLGIYIHSGYHPILDFASLQTHYGSGLSETPVLAWFVSKY